MDFERVLESILFAAGDPYPISRLADLFGLTEAEVSDLADRLSDSLRFENRGISSRSPAVMLNRCGA